MEEPADQHLMSLVRGVRVNHRAAGPYLAIERYIAELVGGQQAQESGPDIVLARDGAAPLAIELKLLNSQFLPKNFRNRISEMLAASVETRRSFRDEVTVVAILLFHGDADGASTRQDPGQLSSELASRLLRANDGVGFDSILVGTAGAELEWKLFATTSKGDLPVRRPTSTREALSLLTMQRPLATRQNRTMRERKFDRCLLVADEWRSGRGGISTVNRELAIALAAAGVDSAVMVPHASAQDIKAASDVDVALVTPARLPGLTDRETLLLRPVFADQSWVPDVIIGHGRLLGPFAAAQQQQFFPHARRIHFVHTDAEQLESAKEVLGGGSRMSDSDARRRLEQELVQSAHLVVGVGPLLAASIRDDLIGREPTSRVICLMPGLREAFDVSTSHTPVRNHVLIVGRADDFHSKGIDIAAEAMLKVIDLWPRDKSHRPVLIIRGVPDEAATEVKARLDAILEGRVKFHLRPFTATETDVTQDLAQARVLLMPSRHEGFGLAAYEAIASGVPVIISAESGLAEFLRDSAIDTSPSSIASTNDSRTRLAVDAWADAIQRVLDAPHLARAQAIALRDSVAGLVNWPSSVAQLLAEFSSP
ncbi:glycosyltransferase family 4 protein [Curtobacterium flaccumfaciens]|uniref:glycosyltransferase family 4 protein n=1 Tax=Curtobacterium flaccumfaciens TaxID=2035 RepID=UPI001BDE1CD1|nr:glycosyltransferase family 4 protein [Curtobacterium flaccumfaciens]MBT1607411.1 glycosyltransferase family 4 protein [Curtobacterium flaccumfaciens pv. betae]MBT1657161.1 glycosyltransferase family 4 protein [Curtobacterium flaccumfaciens pv. betae]MCS0472044.1 glycosyltransferase family 4 protein [Curtobacterium flaccumfaciens pv. betae]MCS0475994.1 glycosyltransferase family 4 protein [Curtobacterium flaccumfaciens pv. betae]MCS0478457.1 glycosyltransferase family 4 protein [Curtobacteri